MKSQMTIGRKITVLAGSLGALSLVLGALALTSLSRVATSVQNLATDALPGVEYGGEIEAGVFRIRGNFWKHIASTTPAEMAAVEQTISALKPEVDKALRNYEDSISQAEDRANFERLRPLVERYYQAWEGVLPLSRALGKQEAYQKYMADLDPAFVAVRDQLLLMTKWNKDHGDKASKAAQNTIQSTRAWTWALLALVVVLATSLSYVMVHGINRALTQAIVELSEGAEQVAGAARQVSTSSQSLAQGSSEQAASLEETSASSEEINAMARRNSETSGEVAGMVAGSQEQFVQTNQSLQQTVVAMGEIHTQSGKISKIIKVIDEIAFQTNILALNAAVEAARAGEAGMGFAVVADEVRNLAQRSAQAARDTAELIEESIAKSNDGKARVDQVAVAIHHITEEFARVKSLVDEVNQGSQEQTRGISEMARAIVQMQSVTQSTAASAEESAAAAEQLTAQSETVKNIAERLTAMVSGS